MVLTRIWVFCALAALAGGALTVRQKIPEPAKVSVEHEEGQKGRLDVAIQERRAARTGLGQHEKISAPRFVRRYLATAAIAQRRRRGHTDSIRKQTKGQRTLAADTKSSKRKVNLSREAGENGDHHKLPHDISSKCSQAKKAKMKAKDIKTKHGELANPPVKNGEAKGCEGTGSSTTSAP